MIVAPKELEDVQTSQNTKRFFTTYFFHLWESRYPGYRGWVEAKDESVFLPLKKGENELIYVITDDQRFGWGFSGRLGHKTPE